MDSKQTIKEVMTCWTDAMTSYNVGNCVKCLEAYGQIEEKSGRILYNMGCANIKLNKTTEALKCFTKSVEKDPLSAIAFFQRGVLLLGERNLDAAMSDFRTAHKLLRGNTFINYKQLGMRCKLHLCEVLYNITLVYLFKGDETRAGKLLTECQYETEYKHKHHISKAWDYLQGKISIPESLKPMTISADVTFSPPKDVMENLNKKNVMGKAKVVSSTNIEDSEPSFNGPKRVEELKTAAIQKSLQPPTSPIMAVRRFLKSSGAKRDRSKSNVQPGMKGSVSMTDLRVRNKSEGFLSESLPAGLQELPDIRRIRLDMQRSASDQRLHVHPDYKRVQRGSSGSNFGNTLSPVIKALSNSFDTLTAVAVPDNNGNTGSCSSHKDSDNLRTSSTSYWSGNQTDDDDVTDVFIDVNNVGKSLAEKSTDHDNSKRVFTFEDSLDSSSSISDIKKDDARDQSAFCAIEISTSANISPRRRKIPPPPSYPPPPLPVHIA